MAILPRRCTLALLAAAALPLAAWPGAPIAPSPAAAVPLARPMALGEAAPPMLLQVKSLRKCKKICVQWKPCPPPWQWQPPGCSASHYPDQPHEGFYCIKSRRVCWLPSTGTHPPNRFSTSPQLLRREPGLSPGGAPAPVGAAPIGGGSGRGR